MSFTDVVSTASAIIVAVGGAGAIVLGFSQYIGKILADKYIEKVKQDLQREIESHKTKLRKSEFLFQKEFDAVSQFIALRRAIVPRYRHPDMDWHEACEEFAQDFDSVEKRLEGYMTAHAAALPRSMVDRIANVITQIRAGHVDGVHGEHVSREAIDVADKALQELEALETDLHRAMHTQSDTALTA